jgi:hypothetical protein
MTNTPKGKIKAFGNKNSVLEKTGSLSPLPD